MHITFWLFQKFQYLLWVAPHILSEIINVELKKFSLVPIWVSRKQNKKKFYLRKTRFIWKKKWEGGGVKIFKITMSYLGGHWKYDVIRYEGMRGQKTMKKLWCLLFDLVWLIHQWLQFYQWAKNGTLKIQKS